MTWNKLTLGVLLQATEADATNHSSATWRLVVVRHWYAIEEVRKLRSNRVVAARHGRRAALYLLAQIPSGQRPARRGRLALDLLDRKVLLGSPCKDLLQGRRLSLHGWCALFIPLLVVVVEDGGGERVGHLYERREGAEVDKDCQLWRCCRCFKETR